MLIHYYTSGDHHAIIATEHPSENNDPSILPEGRAWQYGGLATLTQFLSSFNAGVEEGELKIVTALVEMDTIGYHAFFYPVETVH